MRTMRFVLTFLLVTMLLSLVIGSSTVKALGSEPPKPQLSSNGEWSTFTHPDFGFSFSYPANWYLSNSMSLGSPSGNVSVRSVDPKSIAPGEHGVSGAMGIEIGLHLVEWDETVTPREWTNAYSVASAKAMGGQSEAGEVEVHSVVDLEVDGYPAVREIGTSPFLTYDVVHVQRGKTMWFISSNVAPEYPEVFEQVLQSFHWSDKNRPQSFSNIGIYVPRSKLNVSEEQFVYPTKETTKEEIIEKVRIEPPSRVSTLAKKST